MEEMMRGGTAYVCRVRSAHCRRFARIQPNC